MATLPIRPTPAITILPATRTDIPHLVEILSQSYLPEPLAMFFLLDWPELTAIRPVFQQRMDDRFAALERGEGIKIFKAVLEETGEIVGTITLNEVSGEGRPPVTEEQASGGAEMATGVNMEFVKASLPNMIKMESLMKGKNHFSVTSFGVLPRYQRRGIGALLLEECNGLADAKGSQMFLQAFPGAHDLYLKHGYEEIDHADMDLGKFGKPFRGFGIYRIYAMLRQLKVEKSAE